MIVMQCCPSDWAPCVSCVSLNPALQYLVPGVAQVVAVGVGHGDEGLDGVDVLLLHLSDAGAGSEQGEPGQGLHVRVPLQLHTHTHTHTISDVTTYCKWSVAYRL